MACVPSLEFGVNKAPEDPLGNGQLKLHPAYTVISKYCYSCHAEFKDLNSDFKWIVSGRVSPGSIESSILQYLKYGPSTQSASKLMPRDGASNSAEFSEADYQIIRDWVMNMNPGTTSGGQTEDTEQGLEAIIRLGDRHMVASVLDQVFGPTAKPIIDSLVRSSVSSFGGPCDPRGSVQPGSDSCFVLWPDSNDIQAVMVNSSDVRRESLRLKACRALVFDNTSFKYSIARVAGTVYANQVVSSPVLLIPTEQNIIDTYQLFFPGISPPIRVVGALGNLVSESALDPEKVSDPWRYLMLTVCYAPDWQAY